MQRCLIHEYLGEDCQGKRNWVFYRCDYFTELIVTQEWFWSLESKDRVISFTWQVINKEFRISNFVDVLRNQKKVQVFNEVIQDLARIQSIESSTRPGFRPAPQSLWPRPLNRNITVFERSENPLSIRVAEVRMMKRIFSEMLFLAIFSQINQEGFLCNTYYKLYNNL